MFDNVLPTTPQLPMPPELSTVTTEVVKTEIFDDEDSYSTEWAGEEQELLPWEPQKFPTVNIVTEPPLYEEALNFDEPDTPERKFRHENYKVQDYIGRTRNAQRPIFWTFHTGFGPNLINESALPSNWRAMITTHADPQLRAENGSKMDFWE